MTVITLFVSLGYLFYLLYETFALKYDKVNAVFIPNPFDTIYDQFIFQEDDYVFQPLLFVSKFDFDNSTVPDFDIYKEDEPKIIYGNLNIDHAKLVKYFLPVLVVD